MYRMYDLIMKKRNGKEHTKDEISFLVNGFTKGEIPDYQMSAWLMCVYYNGMTHDETFALTDAMKNSGDCLDLSGIHGIKVDKHSTGGVGDKTTFIVAPILASLGVPVAKMSGRGLGHTGGTIDKLEAIPGFCVNLSEQEFMEHVNTMKLALAGQTGDLAPADKKIYALRDVTATVDSLPLIASSIMSKKLAAGADAIVLDVKCGSGAFMKEKASAEELAKIMVEIGRAAGKKCYGVITDMNEPLGCKVGNALEVIEAVQILTIQNVNDYLEGNVDKSDDDTRNGFDAEGLRRLLVVSLTLAAYMCVAAGIIDDVESARKSCIEAIESGAAFEKFREFVKAQGGKDAYLTDVNRFELAKNRIPVLCEESGYLARCNTSEVGMVNLILGGGRATKESTIHPGVGLDIRKHLGDYVKKGDVLAYLYIDDMSVLEEAKMRLWNAYTISGEKPDVQDIIKSVVA